ncbi:MAG TPA: LuxR C-terminal-related transcriptional regulator, partial [Streptosporangiaceae bacterium]|nr:LuxR C-terminal-related transcriptional regulator [Streptosporangiaceae bacterium]
LIRAMEVAREEIILPFVRLRDVFSGLLAQHPAVAARWPAPRPHPPSEPAMMSAPEIADELCLSMNTVKTYLAATYRELPASRRRDAVTRARQLKLI